jgi:hypothetical protein
LAFDYRLRDPGRAVQRMDVHYRRSASEPFSALALSIDDKGTWRASLPGELTENEGGLELEYYVTTRDAQGRDLLSAGSATSPFTVEVAPGSVADARPLYKSPWFWTAVGAAVLATGFGGFLLYRNMTKLPDTDAFIRYNE